MELVRGFAVGIEVAASETGFLEQAQNLTLLVATLLFALRAYGSSRPLDRAISVNAAVLCGLFFFREIEFPPDAPFAAYFSSRAFRWHEALLVTAILAPYAVLRWRLVPDLIRYAMSRRAWPFILAAVLLLVGYGFDKYGGRYMELPWSKYWEEVAECAAYGVLLLIALFQPSSHSTTPSNDMKA